MIARFRKLPIEVDALRWTGDNAIQTALFLRNVNWQFTHKGINIDTLEGTMLASEGDWIIKGVLGEYYPCKDAVFTLTYEEIDNERKPG